MADDTALASSLLEICRKTSQPVGGALDQVAARKADLRGVLMKEAGCPGARGNPASEGNMEFRSGVRTGHACDTLDPCLGMPEEIDTSIPADRQVNPIGKALARL